MEFNCLEHCKFKVIVKISCSLFAVEPLTDICLVLDVSMSLYENYVMLNHTSPFTGRAPEPL